MIRFFPKFQADVLVAEPNPPGNDEPYTEQMGNCGEKGERIYFTPEFIAGKKLRQYGRKGMGRDEQFCCVSHNLINLY